MSDISKPAVDPQVKAREAADAIERLAAFVRAYPDLSPQYVFAVGARVDRNDKGGIERFEVLVEQLGRENVTVEWGLGGGLHVTRDFGSKVSLKVEGAGSLFANPPRKDPPIPEQFAHLVVDDG